MYGADEWPADALVARVVRSTHDHAAFVFGDISARVAAHPGVVAAFTGMDAPWVNRFGAIAAFADQPVLAETHALFRGDAVALVVGEPEAIAALDLSTFPLVFEPPPIDCLIIEDPSSEGPFGAKGVGEQALIPTAPAIFNAIHHATGVRIRRAPATPDRLRAALREKEMRR
ncbi:MAG: hypothetical protein ACLPN5_15375 [Roseiarcus sp.]